MAINKNRAFLVIFMYFCTDDLPRPSVFFCGSLARLFLSPRRPGAAFGLLMTFLFLSIVKNKFLFKAAAAPMMAGFSLSDNWQYILQKLAASVDKTRNRLSPNLGLLPFLLSEENDTSAQFDLSGAMELNQGNGKQYTVVRRFYPRQGEEQHNAQTLQFCDISGSSKPYKEDTITVGYEHVSAPLILDDRMIRCVQDDRDTFLGDRMAEHLRTYLQSLARAVAKRVVTGGFVGKHPDGTTGAKDVPLLSADGAAINPVGEIQLMQDKRAAQLDDDFRLIGGTRLDVYRLARRIASGNDLGFDASLSEQRNAVYFDSQVTAEMATEYGVTDGALAMAAGALKFVSFNKFAGDFAYMSDKQERTTIVDPYLGLTHDVVYITEDCGEEVVRSIQFRTYYDVVGYPACWSEDECFDGITDVFAYNVICADASLCDISDQECRPDAPDLTENGSTCEPGVDPCVPFLASFASECITQVQYDHSAGLVGPATYDRIIIGGTPYLFTQSYTRTTPADFAEMSKEILQILTDNALGDLVWVNSGGENLTIFADPGLAIQLGDGLTATTLDESPGAGTFLKVENTTAGDPIETAVWLINGTPYVAGVGPLNFIDPTGDVLGTGGTFYLSGSIITSVVNLSLTAIRGGLSANVVGTAGPCV